MLPKLALAGTVTACQGGKLQTQSYNSKWETDSLFPLGVSRVEQNGRLFLHLPKDSRPSSYTIALISGKDVFRS